MTPEERLIKDRQRWNAYDAAHREERRAKDRARYAANRGRLLEKNRAYHVAHRETILTRQQARAVAKRDADLARKRTYNAEHKAYMRADARRRYWSLSPEKRQAATKKWNLKYEDRRRQWRERNKKRLAKLAAEWTRKNVAKKSAASARRKANKLRATPAWADRGAIDVFYAGADRLTRETGIKHEVDHIIPLKNPLVCGLHVAWNLRVITQTDNRRKSNKLIAA